MANIIEGSCLMRNSRKSLIIDYQRTFNTEAGKAVLADLRKKAPLLMGGLDIKGGVDVNALLVSQGRVDVVLHIYKMLRLDPYAEREEHAISKGE
jgi:hypothetical protein